MEYIVKDEICPDCGGDGTLFYVFHNPQLDYDQSCGRCFGLGVVERNAYTS